MLGFDCEMNREYVKEWVWEGRNIQDGDQTYFFAKQSRKERLYIQRNLDFIITDSPLILTHFYGNKYDPVEQKYNTSLAMLKNHHGFCKDNGYKVDHFFLTRTTPYNASGRNEDEATAQQFDTEIKALLDSLDIKYTELRADKHIIQNILDYYKLSVV